MAVDNHFSTAAPAIGCFHDDVDCHELIATVYGMCIYAVIIIIYSFNVKSTGATFNNASTRYIINPKACKQILLDCNL